MKNPQVQSHYLWLHHLPNTVPFALIGQFWCQLRRPGESAWSASFVPNWFNRVEESASQVQGPLEDIWKAVGFTGGMTSCPDVPCPSFSFPHAPAARGVFVWSGIPRRIQYNDSSIHTRRVAEWEGKDPSILPFIASNPPVLGALDREMSYVLVALVLSRCRPDSRQQGDQSTETRWTRSSRLRHGGRLRDRVWGS